MFSITTSLNVVLNRVEELYNNNLDFTLLVCLKRAKDTEVEFYYPRCTRIVVVQLCKQSFCH